MIGNKNDIQDLVHRLFWDHISLANYTDLVRYRKIIIEECNKSFLTDLSNPERAEFVNNCIDNQFSSHVDSRKLIDGLSFKQHGFIIVDVNDEFSSLEFIRMQTTCDHYLRLGTTMNKIYPVDKDKPEIYSVPLTVQLTINEHFKDPDSQTYKRKKLFQSEVNLEADSEWIDQLIRKVVK